MKIVSFTQGTDEWLHWRKNGLGASDMGIVMGSNRFSTHLQLWEIKCGFRKEDPINPAMAHGIKYEDVARKWVNKNQQLMLEPLCIEDVENPHFKASLDGYDDEKKILCEIKCPVSEDILDKVRKHQNMPLYWQHQIQWQIMLCKPVRAFVAIWDYRYESCITIEAFAQPTLQKEMIDNANEFWRKIQMGVAPKPSPKDYVKIEDQKLKELLDEYRDHDSVSKAAVHRKKELKEEIVEFGDDGNFTAYGYFMTRTSPRTVYDMEQMRIDGIDIEKYVKKNNSIGYYRISLPKD